MSGYRSIKRILGEKSLSSSNACCYSAACLFLMLGFTFLERLIKSRKVSVIKNTNNVGRGWATIAIVNLHWEGWKTDPKRIRQLVQKELYQEPWFRDNFKAKLLWLPDPVPEIPDEGRWLIKEASKDADEEAVLRRLQVIWQEQLKEEQSNLLSAVKGDNVSLNPLEQKNITSLTNFENTPTFETSNLARRRR